MLSSDDIILGCWDILGCFARSILWWWCGGCVIGGQWLFFLALDSEVLANVDPSSGDADGEGTV